MDKITSRLTDLIALTEAKFLQFSEEEVLFKKAKTSWSKKEILGHLIDSGINNLQRFTEIQFATQPYSLCGYQQNELVIANDYHNTHTPELLVCWSSLNKRIVHVISRLSQEQLIFKIEKDDKPIGDLNFLIEDYVRHLEHHLRQIGIL